MSPLERAARNIALRLHAAQTYGGRVPFAFHLAAVVGVLNRMKSADDELCAAAWLHDSLEDTDATPAALVNQLVEYGNAEVSARNVVQLVQAVTDPKGLTRRQKLPLMGPRVRAAGYRAVTLKLADRIANVEASLLVKDSRYEMYKQEHGKFHEALFVPGEAVECWAHLEALFRAS